MKWNLYGDANRESNKESKMESLLEMLLCYQRPKPIYKTFTRVCIYLDLALGLEIPSSIHHYWCSLGGLSATNDDTNQMRDNLACTKYYLGDYFFWHTQGIFNNTHTT